ncbi:Histidinol dehydrogenase [Morus notabilis]|uniref:histidinol dehydrogenase n=1 Tax=Morus notabilis TaxID=981085 RepID=W9RFM1_9ROSA|nr:Histidinol dehydrogenase [Morus notabilis]
MDSQIVGFNRTSLLNPNSNYPLRFRVFGAPKIPFPRSNCSSGGNLSYNKGIKCAMKSYKLSELSTSEVESLKTRPRIDFSSIFTTVNPIVDHVRRRGDAAVKEYTLKFDKVELDRTVVSVFELPDPELDPVVQEAFDVAYDNIYAFHFAQKSAERSVENMKGVKCKRVARSIASVGLYVPGGTAVLPSTALMLAIPAKIAGCKTVVLATPPSQGGSICKEVLYCAKKAGVTHILKAGGAQAISAMAWGTESCPKVEKIFGPGNQYVTAAKMILQNSEAMVAIDMPAGPSEVLVIADKYASPVHIAADLLSQAEHGPDSQVVLVLAGDGVDFKAIEDEIKKQCDSLPRGEFASKALSHSFTVFARDMVEAVSFSNLYAPEHLIVNVKDADKWEGFIENAGSVFLGQWTPESVGDYASGTNHVLPTYGYARMYGGVSLDSFLKYMTVQSLTEEGLRKLGPHVATMAEVEGLEAHKRAVTLRLKDIEARQVRIKSGIYKERVEIENDTISLIGDDAATTTITFDRSNATGFKTIDTGSVGSTTAHWSTYITITAQNRASTSDVDGFSFRNCNVKPSPESTHTEKANLRVFLGQPWENYSQILERNSVFGSPIYSQKTMIMLFGNMTTIA